MRFADYKRLCIKEDGNVSSEFSKQRFKQGFKNMGHIITKPPKEDLICILQPIYPKANLAVYSHDQLFDVYKKNIEAGKIPYDKSKGYLGPGCPNNSSSSSAEQSPKTQEPKKDSWLYRKIREQVCKVNAVGTPNERVRKRKACESAWK